MPSAGRSTKVGSYSLSANRSIRVNSLGLLSAPIPVTPAHFTPVADKPTGVAANGEGVPGGVGWPERREGRGEARADRVGAALCREPEPRAAEVEAVARGWSALLVAATVEIAVERINGIAYAFIRAQDSAGGSDSGLSQHRRVRSMS